MPGSSHAVERLLALLTVVLTLVLGSLSPVAAATSSATPTASSAVPTEAAATEGLAAGTSISGLVYDENDHLLDNIVVEAMRAEDPAGDPVASAITYELGPDAHGAYRLDLPGGGDYVVRFASLERADKVYETVYYGGGAGAAVTVEDDETKDLDAVTMVQDTGAPVDGIVVNADRDPIANISVGLFNYSSRDDEWYFVDEAITDAAGHYRFVGVNRNREHTVQAYGESDLDGEPLGYTSTFLGGALLASQAGTFTLPGGSPGTTLGPITLQRAIDVTGQLKDAAGKGIRFGEVQLLAKDPGGGFEGVQLTQTSTSGAYQFSGVAAGHEYTVLARGEDDFSDTYLGDVDNVDHAQTFVPASSASPLVVDPITFIMPEVRATGTVKRAASGAPMQGVRITLLRQVDDGDSISYEEVEHRTTGEDGSYELRKPREGGVYTVEADGFTVGFGLLYLGDSDSQFTADTFTLPAGGAHRELSTISLDRDSGRTIAGRVVLGGTDPFDGLLEARLRQWVADAPGDPATGHFETVDVYEGHNPHYTFRDVEPGQYTVSVEYFPNGAQEGLYHPGALGGADATTLGDPGVLTVAEDAEEVNAGDITLERGVWTSGKVTTDDGGPFSGEITIDLYRWDEDALSFTYARSTSAWGDDFGFADLDPGVYAAQFYYYAFDPADRYMGGWRGGAEPTAPGDPGTFVVSEPPADQAGVNLQLRQGTRVSGVVRSSGASAVRIADAAVSLYGWQHRVDAGNPDASHWDLVPLESTVTDEDGRYSVLVGPGQDVFASATRDGFAPAFLGGADDPTEPAEDRSNAVPVAGAGVVLDDLVMAPAWGAVGSVAGEQRDYCLARPLYGSQKVPFGPRGLWVAGTGIISYQNVGNYRPELLGSQGRVSILAPFMDRVARYHRMDGSTTWGLSPDGSTLCVLWNGPELRATGARNTYQALVTKAADGYDVTFNYDAVPGSSEPNAGYSDGAAGGGRALIPDGANGGYEDDAGTGLVHNGTGSTPGRYTFHFDGFDPVNRKPDNVERPTVDGTSSAGETLTATAGTWYVGPARRDDLEIAYTWMSNASGLATPVGFGPTYVVRDADKGHQVWVSVQASEGAPMAGFASSARKSIAVGPPAATIDAAPLVSPAAPRVGATLSATHGEWTAADDGTLGFDYQWLVDDKPIRGATEPNYVVQDDDEGRAVRVRVTARQDGHAPASSTSAPVTVQSSPALANTVAPSITGAPAVGKTLTVDAGDWSTGGPEPTFTYKWVVDYRTVNADPGSGGTEYTPRTTDLGKYVSVIVYATSPGFKTGFARATSPAVAAADAAFGSLTGTVTRESDGAVVVGAQWQACEHETWSCVWGTTGSGGALHSSSVRGTTGGVPYSVTVYAPTGTGLRDGSTTAVVRAGMTTDHVDVSLAAVAQLPANVGVPTRTGTHQGDPTVFWGQAQQIRVEGCPVASPTYTVWFSDGHAPRHGALTALADQSGVAAGLTRYGATIPPFYPAHGTTTIGTNIPADCDSDTPATTFTVYVDPSGVVSDQYGRPIPGATVTLMRAGSATGEFSVVPDGSDVMSEDNRTNPDTTDENGFFRWDVSEGLYRLKVSAPGCTPFTTAAVPVPPPAIDLFLKLDCAGTPSASPLVTGTPKLGQTLSSPPVWADGMGETVSWLRDGVTQVGTGSTYRVSTADLGHTLSAVHHAQRPAYTQDLGRGVPVTFTALPDQSSQPVTVAKLGSTTAATPARNPVSRRTAVKMVLKVAVSGLVPTGRITVYRNSRALKSFTMTAASRGRMTVTLGKFKKGTYRMAAKYLGNGQIAGSWSRTVTLRVR